MTHLAVGDYVYQRGYLQQIKQAYPHIQLDIWIDDFRKNKKDYHDARSDFLSQWLAQEAFIDKVFPIAKSLKQREALVTKAKRQHYDVVMFIAGTRSRKFARYANYIGQRAGYCVGVINAKCWPLDKIFFERLLDSVIVSRRQSRDINIRDRYKQQFSQLSGIDCHNQLLPLGTDDTLRTRVKKCLATWHYTYKTNFAWMVNGISTTSKRDYSWQKLRQVIIEVARVHPNWLIVVNAPPHQIDTLTAQVQALRKEHSVAVVAFTAKNGVGELSSMISQMNGILSVETAIIHFAAVLGIPQVVLMRAKTVFWCPPEAKYALIANKQIDELAPSLVAKTCLAHLVP